MIEVAFDEFTLVLAGFFFALGKVGAANHELVQHQAGRFRAVELLVQGAPPFDSRHTHFPRTVGEHDDVRAQLGRRQD